MSIKLRHTKLILSFFFSPHCTAARPYQLQIQKIVKKLNFAKGNFVIESITIISLESIF